MEYSWATHVIRRRDATARWEQLDVILLYGSTKTWRYFFIAEREEEEEGGGGWGEVASFCPQYILTSCQKTLSAVQPFESCVV